MRVGLFFLVASFGAFSASVAHAAPQCSDGIDNDGDGQIDYAGGNFGTAPADDDCRSPGWNSESSRSDMGNFPYDGGSAVDGGTGRIDGGTGIVDGGTPQTVDAGNSFEHPDGGGATNPGGGGGGGSGSNLDPPRHGCDLGGSASPTLPILLLLATGGGLALLSRRKRA